MTTAAISNEASKSFAAIVKCRPLVSYFTLAFAGTWITFAPVWLSSRGLGVIPVELPDAMGILLFVLAVFTGPALAAYVVTAIESGRAGVWQFVRRYGQWRVGLHWYLLPLLGYPLLLLAGASFTLGDAAPLTNLLARWPLIFSAYLPAVAVGMIMPSLGEEPGWRGFALPRLQARYGPLAGSLILGTLHALWHLPAYLVTDMIAPGGFDLTLFVANSAAIVAATFVWTWLFNNARGSILYAMLVHAVSNASVAFAMGLTPTLPTDPWLLAKLFGLCALLVTLFTRGRLSYKPERAN